MTKQWIVEIPHRYQVLKLGIIHHHSNACQQSYVFLSIKRKTNSNILYVYGYLWNLKKNIYRIRLKVVMAVDEYFLVFSEHYLVGH